jgi:hypothetical protein
MGWSRIKREIARHLVIGASAETRNFRPAVTMAEMGCGPVSQIEREIVRRLVIDASAETQNFRLRVTMVKACCGPVLQAH